ncbi:hypothetical protein QJS10_CPA09g00370 [Acorus calamus]|uniref:SAP domain-containing protein n=1 Tax=Acorus calamus TaxID=4465 RepID=A0AAV9E357_ACOCL|nr:hypothetical protein QJS10_CPA09g00370 [Acorus calamus]
MFKNKILVRSDAPPSTTSSFHLRQLTLSTPSPFPPPLSLHIDSLCWSLSRRHRLSCLSQSHHIYVIYLVLPRPHHHPLVWCSVVSNLSFLSLVLQGNQSTSAAEVVEEIVGTLSISHVGEEEEVECGSVIAKAIECGLRCVFLEREWRCVCDGYFVDSCFSRDEEKKHLLAFHLLEDMLSLKLRQQFDCGEEVVVDCDSFLTSCSILPSLVDGHVIGVSKSPPSGKHFDRLEELWSFKDICRIGIGLDLPLWQKATDNIPSLKNKLDAQESTNDIFSALRRMLSDQDFRTPKPASGLLFVNKKLEQDQIHGGSLSPTMELLGDSDQVSQKVVSTDACMKYRPVFKDRKSVKGGFRIPRSGSEQVLAHKFPEQNGRQGNSKPTSNGTEGDSCESLQNVVSVDASATDHFKPSFMGSKSSGKFIHSDCKVKETLPLVSNDKGSHRSNSVSKGKPSTEKQASGKASEKKENAPNKRAKQHVDPSDITTKVNDYYKRSQLGSLTVPELKCFLVTKKAKVGGKKEDLIQRVVDLLGDSISSSSCIVEVK